VTWAASVTRTFALADGDADHWVRLYDVLPSHSRIEATQLDDAALVAWGDTAVPARASGARRLSAAHRAGGAGAGRAGRDVGPTMEPLFYDVPVEVADADGVWITDSAGRRYLDAYNNVPCVGHSHPRVTTAIARQSRQINTHMRYLHPAAIELAERLAGLCPPELDTVLLVNSGSEANDLAWPRQPSSTG